MDDRVCDEIFQRIDDRQIAQLLILAFRKANRYQTDPAFEQIVMKQDPGEGLSELLHQEIKAIQEQ